MFKIKPSLFLDTTTETTGETTTTSVSAVDVIESVSNWSGMSQELTSAIMGALAGAILILGTVWLVKKIKKYRRGYYR